MEQIMKNCPLCAEKIKEDAIKCRYCGELLNAIDEKKAKKINSNTIKPNTILSIGLIISFFLPWFSVPFFDISGFNIPTSIDKIISIGSIFGKDMTILKFSYLLYLIPIVSVYNIIVDFWKIKSTYFINEFFIGLFCSVAIYYLLTELDKNLTKTLGIGFYMTIFISIIGLIMTSPLFENLINKKIKNYY